MASSPEPQPTTHGQVHVPDHHPREAELTKMLTDHLAQHVAHANTTADYGGHGMFSNQGGFQQGGAAGADYETTSVGDTPDADSGGPSGL
jgi:hypothetical protein